MAALTNPIEETNLASRFADYVAAAANDSITWGTNAKPDYQGTQVVPNNRFGGPISGRAAAPGSAITAGTSKITASTLTTLFRNETQAYLYIRKLRAKLNVTGGGGNTGTRPTAGIVYDNTAKAYLSPTYFPVTLGTIAGNPTSGTPVTVTGLQTYFTTLQARYIEVRDDTQTHTTDVCHASCHSSCHSSRGRR
tara:strand:- start:2562 stop:3143 length:582 start_codon:yes stop_codon:yes gene_type:complete